MGILQKVFDKSIASMERNWDKIEDDGLKGAFKQPVTTLKAFAAGMTCEATGLAAKITKKPLDTSKSSVTGMFF
jgi:hypothetical protein